MREPLAVPVLAFFHAAVDLWVIAEWTRRLACMLVGMGVAVGLQGARIARLACARIAHIAGRTHSTRSTRCKGARIDALQGRQ